MKKRVKSFTAFLLVLLMAASLAAPALAAADTSELGALADSFTSNSSTFTLSASSRFFIVADEEADLTEDLLQTVRLAQRQFAADGRPSENVLPIVWGEESWAKDGDIVVKLDPSSGLATEAYKLAVTTKAVVTASDVDGLLYGLNALQKHFRVGDSNTIKGFTATDAPDTVERTVHLDVARKYFTKDWICNFIREMSWMGYNALELHFSEDGGFRMDIWDPAYYKGDYNPVNDFSWICGSHVQSWVGDAYANDPDAGKYLTMAEVIEILEVAKEYHMDVIPSFDSPAHMDYLCWKYQDYYNDGHKDYSFVYTGNGVGNEITYYAASPTSSDMPAGCINYCGYNSADYPEWCEYTTVNINDELSKAFVFQLYIDIADFFKEYAGSTEFSIGADEVNLTASSLIKWDYDDFPGYINDLNKLLNDKDYTMRMFNDFIRADYLDQFDDNIEILYWNSPYHPNLGYNYETSILSVQSLVNDGRVLYNTIQTNTYYALRVADTLSSSDANYMKDARDPSNTQWTFYHSDEDSIYDEWYPADISEHGLYSEDVADVPTSQLGGAYFLLWNDYAAVATESQVWNGMDSNGKWNVIDRMWSNTIKMWNWDINDSVTYQEYAVVRDQLGDFPGLTTCSAETVLPAASTTYVQAYLADHSALVKALETRHLAENYTAESYAVYEAAYNAAVAVNEDHGATTDELADAISALQAAEKTLQAKLTIELKGTGSDVPFETITEVLEVGATGYNLYVSPQNGYEYQRISSNASFMPLLSGDGSGYVIGTINGKVSGGMTVTVWYKNLPDLNRLNDLIAEGPTEQGDYTDSTWDAYQTVLNTAKNFVIYDTTNQSHVDKVVNDLEQALSKLSTGTEETAIIEVEKLTGTARFGKQVGLRITTTPDVEELTVSGETLTVCTGKVQTLSTGETVKIWLVLFPADEKGTFNYTITAGSATEDIEIVVQ